MTDDAMTDAEALAWADEMVRGSLVRLLDVKIEGGTEEQALEAAADGMHEAFVRVRAEDIREIGTIKCGPRVLWHWVYRDRRNPAKIYMISLKNRWLLQAQGFADLQIFTTEGSN